MRIAIVGGGIVGLTTALSLAAAGLRAKVYEAVDEVQPLGVGINLLPHAVRELAELGLLDEVAGSGVEIDELVYLMSDGRRVWSEPRGLAAGYRWPQIAIHRGVFQMLLLRAVRNALGPESVRLGAVLRGFEERRSSVALVFRQRADGRTPEQVEADVVIAADGIHSSVRKQLYPAEGRPVWNGVSLFRGTVRVPRTTVQPRMLWAGHSDQKFIAYPVSVDRDRNEALLNFVCDLRTGAPGSTPHEDWNRIVDPGALIPRYAQWKWEGLDVPSLLAASGRTHEFPMMDRDPLPRWSFGRVTLAGDAAHPMYPIGSNGATQGIIDARVLAYHLATTPDPVVALERYQQARLGPTTQIVLSNRAQGPDRILEVARQRASDPMVDLDRAIPLAERAEIAASYKRVAGFDPASLNGRASYSIAKGDRPTA